MKKTSCGLIAVLAAVGLAAVEPDCSSAAELACEDFDDYAAGALTNGAGGRGWDGPWVVPHGLAAVSAFDPALGLGATLSGNTRAGRKLDVRQDGPLGKAGLIEQGLVGKDGGTLYVGFLQQVSTVPVVEPGGPAYLRFYGFEFNTGDSDGTRSLQIGHDDRSNPEAPHCYGVASVVNNNRPDAEPGQFQSLGAQDTGVNMIVVKFTFGPDNRDTVQVFRNPRSETDEAACTVDATLTGNFQFDRIALARFVGGEPVHRVDEIRLGTEFGDVFPPKDEQKREALLAKAQERADRLSQTLAESGLGTDKLLFVKRRMFQSTHIYTEYSDGPFRPGGGIFTLSPIRPDGKVTMLFDAEQGILRDPEISFDAQRVLFSYRKSEQEYYHIHEMNVDGGDLRQITDGPFHDLDPLYLPDGRIAFTSNRCKSRVLCFHTSAATLFVMDADGGHIQPLTANNVNEFTPDLLPDGRILYTRWEYMDKSAIFVQGLWSILPDGAGARQIFGNNLIHPVSLLQARRIPDTRKIACVLSGHNGNSVGPLAVIDPSRGANNPAAILNLAPEVNYDFGCFAPYPINHRWCLVSYGPVEPFGVYLFELDPPAESISPATKVQGRDEPQFPSDLGKYWASASGRRHLIYSDREFSCVEAIPIRRRPKPSMVASTLARDESAEADQQATLLLADVYQGLGDAVPRGQVKYLRVVEEMGHRNYQGEASAGDFMGFYAAPWETGRPAPSLQAKHVWGTVPVEADGSAYFVVPARRPIYFQALDEHYNEIQRMRSYIHLEPGERRSCIGCHEPRHTAPSSSPARAPLAFGREPSAIEPPPWGAGGFSYLALVQPVFDQHCTSCHGPNEPAGGVDLSAGRDGRGAPASFSALVRPRTNPDRPPLANFFDSWWGVSWTVPVARPLSFGAAESRLIEVLDRRHQDVAMSEADRAGIDMLTPLERRVVTTWIDLNCPLRADYRAGAPGS